MMNFVIVNDRYKYNFNCILLMFLVEAFLSIFYWIKIPRTEEKQLPMAI